MSSENFESLEDDFLSLKQNLATKIEDFLPKSSGQSSKNLQRDIQREMDDAHRLLDDLDLEAKAAPYPFRLQMTSKVKTHRQSLALLKKKVVQYDNNLAASNRTQLLSTSSSGQSLSGPSGSSFGTAAGNRGRLLQMNETIDRTSESVRRTQQVAAETDQVAVAVVDELGTQRESLIRTKERLVDTDANLSRSRKILRSMYRRVMTNKLILVVIILLEIGILSGLVYYKFFR